MTAIALLWLRGRLSALWGICARYPLQVALCASLVACWWLYRGKERAEDNLTAAYAAWDKARADQQALRARETQAYQEKAHDADQSYRAGLADARSATADYIRAHRVQPARGGSPALAVSAPGVAGVPESLPADPFVAVSDSDVQACTGAVIYAVEAHNHAISISGDH